MMGDGRLGKCKECTKRDVKTNYAVKREQYTAYERRRRPRKYPPDTNEHVLPVRVLSEEQRSVRRLARTAVSNAIRDKRLVRQPCEVCNNPKVQAHHIDYSKPLEVRWLCLEHHGNRHTYEHE